MPKVNVNQLIGRERHWDISLSWGLEGLRVCVRPQHGDCPMLEGAGV